MATKTAAKKKVNTKGKVMPTKTGTKGSRQLPSLYRERNPESHCLTGKYVFFYVVFSLVMILFAALAVYLLCVCTDLSNKYESIEECARTHGCRVTIDDDENSSDTVIIDEGTEE